MGLRDEAMRHGTNYQRKEIVLRALGDEREEFEQLLADITVPPNGLWHALRNRGFKVAHSTVHRWAQEARHGSS